MTNPLPIPASAIEAAARALFPSYDGGSEDWKAGYRENVEEGLRAFCEALGIHRQDYEKGELHGKIERIWRFESRWFQDEPGETLSPEYARGRREAGRSRERPLR